MPATLIDGLIMNSVVRHRSRASVGLYVLRSCAILPKLALGGSFGAMVALVCVEVFLRTWLGTSLAWYDEVSRVLFVWSAFLGAATAVRSRTHYMVPVINALQAHARKLTLLADVIVGIVSFVLAWQGVVLALEERDQILPVTGWSVDVETAALIVGCALMCIYTTANILQRGNSGMAPCQ